MSNKESDLTKLLTLKKSISKGILMYMLKYLLIQQSCRV